MKTIRSAEVASVFKTYPPVHRRRLLQIRDLIFKTAHDLEGVGEIEETLKWGEPAYLTPETGSGSTIRVAWKKSTPDQCAIHFHCQTNLVATFRKLYPDCFHFERNRSILFHRDDVIPTEPLSSCIALALTYHQRKRSSRS